MDIKFNIGIPIYKQLASLIKDQIDQGIYKPGQQIPTEAVFAPPVMVENSVDPTGCGNCSTAAALIGLAEGLPLVDAAVMANIAAGFNAQQIGPWPKVDAETQTKAKLMMEKLKSECEKN